MGIAKLAAAASVAALMATGASAATLSLSGGVESAPLMGNDLGFNGQTVTYIDGASKTATNGLWLDAPARVTFTYLGFEASNANYAANIGGAFFTNAASTVGATISVLQLAAGWVDFGFGTSSPAGAVGLINNDGTATPPSPDYAIGYKQISSTSWYAFFDDIAAGDRDFDDIAIRIDVAPVPVPAAGLLLIGGLGALGAFARRRKAA